MAGARVTDRDMGMKRIVRQLKGIDGLSITVGHHEKNTDGTTIAYIAAVHEFGAPKGSWEDRPEMSIPPRPTLGPTLDKNQKKYSKELASLNARMLTGGAGKTPEGVAAVFGSQVVADVKRFLTDLREPALAESTIAAKGSSNPLIDTGAMRDDIDFRVEKAGEKAGG